MASRKLRNTSDEVQTKKVQGRSRGITKKANQQKGRKSVTKMKKLPDDEPTKTRRSLRCSPMETYDFIGDSPVPAVDKEKKQTAKNTKVISKNNTNSKTKSACPKNNTTKPKSSMNTPKTRVRKVPQPVQEDKRQGKREKKRAYSPLPPPRLDDLSPIGHDAVTSSNDVKNNKRKLRSSTDKQIVETPSVSFIVPRSKLEVSNDSAIFVSPRKTMPNFGTEKTSTPAEVPNKKKKKLTKGLLAKNTSTPNEIKPLRQYSTNNASTPNEIKPLKQYTVIKSAKAKQSPIPRTETPTSDYCSMELFETPDAPTTDFKKRAHSPDPVFKDDDCEDSISLNKSLDRSYKQRTKRKYESSKKTESRMEEWIEKVNSELEDVENFELSVEG